MPALVIEVLVSGVACFFSDDECRAGASAALLLTSFRGLLALFASWQTGCDLTGLFKALDSQGSAMLLLRRPGELAVGAWLFPRPSSVGPFRPSSVGPFSPHPLPPLRGFPKLIRFDQALPLSLLTFFVFGRSKMILFDF
jgi:hypothetical protein